MKLNINKDRYVSQSFEHGLKPTELHTIDTSKKEAVIGPKASGTGDYVNIDANFWLPLAAEHYKISKDLRDYILVPVPSVITELPNTNGDAVTKNELLQFDPETGLVAYKTFKAKPTFLEHCFPKDTLITTKLGFKKIQNIEVDDIVLTHTGAHKKVLRTYDNGEKSLSKINVQGLGEHYATSNHPYWIVDKRQIFGLYNEEKQCRDPALKRHDFDNITPHFRPLTDVYTGDYVVLPIYVGGNTDVDKDLAFLTGIYAAEGSFSKYKNCPITYPYSHGMKNATSLTIGYHEEDLLNEICACLDNLDYTYRLYQSVEQGTTRIDIPGKELAEFFYKAVGEYSHKKHLKNVRNWNDESLRHFLGGYVSGDGCVNPIEKGGRLRTVTVSRRLALDIQNLWARLGVPATITNSKSGEMTTTYKDKTYSYKSRETYHVGVLPYFAEFLNEYIVGKEVKTKELTRRASPRLIVTDSFILAPILTIQHEVYNAEVYNFEVEDDNSYVANGIAVHNCNQDITKAKGVILDTYLKVLRGFGNDKHYKLIKLAAYDRTKDPELCRRILDGEVTTYSMGLYFDSFSCSVCNNQVGKNYGRACEHTALRKPTYMHSSGRLAYRLMHGIKGFELSSVVDPAYVVAISPADHVINPQEQFKLTL